MVYKQYYPKFIEIDDKEKEQFDFSTLDELRSRITLPQNNNFYELLFCRYHTDRIIVSIQCGKDLPWVWGFIFGTTKELDDIAK